MNRKLAITFYLMYLVSTPLFAENEKIKVFFDKDWTICKPENAMFYRIGNWNDNLKFYDGEFTDFQLNNSIVAHGNYKNKYKNGLFIFYDENGAKKLEATFTDDKPSGIWNWYFPNEQINYKLEFQDDEFKIVALNNFNGKSILEKETIFTYASLNYFENYSLLIEGKLINGEKDGKWKSFLNRKSLGYDLYKDGEFIKSKYNVEIPSTAKPKVVNNYLFVPKSIIEIEKLKFSIEVTESDYHFLSFLFPWEAIIGAKAITGDMNVFEPDIRPMYFNGLNGLNHDIARGTRYGIDVIKYCKNWGYIYYELILDESGDVVEKNILKSPDKMLNSVLLRSLEGIGEFKPAIHNSKAVKSKVLLRAHYKKPVRR